jgi:hypothetical protein
MKIAAAAMIAVKRPFSAVKRPYIRFIYSNHTTNLLFCGMKKSK